MEEDFSAEKIKKFFEEMANQSRIPESVVEKIRKLSIDGEIKKAKSFASEWGYKYMRVSMNGCICMIWNGLDSITLMTDEKFEYGD